MESDWHVLQMFLLRECLELYWADRTRYFVGTNMFLYYSAERLLRRDFRGPDVFVALDVDDHPRKSWVVWDEGKAPDVVIELLSETTAEFDRTVKKQEYQDKVRVPEYFWYDPDNRELAGFVLCDGLYQPIAPDEAGRLFSPRLGLYLTRWCGRAGRLEAEWIRWETPEGVLLPSRQEHAEEADRRAEAEHLRAERLAERLRALGLNPDKM
jgi:Uma2 family endonuclease